MMRTLYLVLIMILPFFNWAQSNYQIIFKNNSYQQFVKRPKVEFKDSISAKRYLSDFQKQAISKGYILASYDSIHYEPKKVSVHFSLGEKMNKVVLSLNDEDIRFIRKNSRLNEKIISQTPFTPVELASTIKKIEDTYLNNGHPFVRMKLAKHVWDDDQLHVTLEVNAGKFDTWAKINVKGDSAISPKYISNLLNIRIGDPFSEKEIAMISSRINQVPFIKEIKPSEILFTKEGVELFLYLESVPISSANGIIGFQPDPVTQKLGITGDIHLKLMDVFHRGELLDLQWQSIRKQTQSLDIKINYPFLFNTSFGLDGAFNLYKRDSSFLELNSTAGVQYFLKKGNYLKVFYNNISSSVLSGGGNNPSFTNLGSVKSNNYGISYTYKQIDYVPNPSRGLNFLIEGAAGTRTSQVSDTLEKLKSTTFRGKVIGELFIPVFKRHVIRVSSATEFYFADRIFENEVYRYGGLNSQRGFNEDALFATTKTTATIEYRFLLDENSHVFAFFDQSWYENNAKNYYYDSPFGFGAGFAFSTSFGVFSISYALGKEFSNPIKFSNSKVHFGYNVYF
ncbi:MAG: hypothetical protein QNL61_10435 [Crocinitomicaceae bacterium]